MNFTKLCLWSFVVSLTFIHAHAQAQQPDVNTPIEDLQFKDPALKQCIQDWSMNEINQYKTLGEVKEIACAHYGIQNLDGLEVMLELLAIDLSHNPIKDYGPLNQLNRNLGFLWLWGNDISCEQFFKLQKNLKRTWIGGVDLEDCLQ